MAAILFAVAGAFAFSSVPQQDDAAWTPAFGHLPNAMCSATTIQCQIENNGTFCKNASQVSLYRQVGTDCNVPLYKAPN